MNSYSFIHKMGDQELYTLRRELERGRDEMLHAVTEQIRIREAQHQRICATCNSIIDDKSDTNFTLIFGPADLRKRATFCAFDCLEYFFAGIKRGKVRQQ